MYNYRNHNFTFNEDVLFKDASVFFFFLGQRLFKDAVKYSKEITLNRYNHGEI